VDPVSGGRSVRGLRDLYLSALRDGLAVENADSPRGKLEEAIEEEVVWSLGLRAKVRMAEILGVEPYYKVLVGGAFPGGEDEGGFEAD
ncbi:MAG: hypothetical protein AAF196_14265, partial [Planctomycetota bacterium]